jgi:hypothetical protein
MQSLKLEYYLSSFSGKEDKPCDLGTLLQPFGLALVAEQDPDYLVGHFLDYLVDQLSASTHVSVLDVARVAYDLECVDSDLLLLSLQGLETT